MFSVVTFFSNIRFDPHCLTAEYSVTESNWFRFGDSINSIGQHKKNEKKNCWTTANFGCVQWSPFFVSSFSKRRGTHPLAVSDAHFSRIFTFLSFLMNCSEAIDFPVSSETIQRSNRELNFARVESCVRKVCVQETECRSYDDVRQLTVHQSIWHRTFFMKLMSRSSYFIWHK